MAWALCSALGAKAVAPLVKAKAKPAPAKPAKKQAASRSQPDPLPAAVPAELPAASPLQPSPPGSAAPAEPAASSPGPQGAGSGTSVPQAVSPPAASSYEAGSCAAMYAAFVARAKAEIAVAEPNLSKGEALAKARGLWLKSELRRAHIESLSEGERKRRKFVL